MANVTRTPAGSPGPGFFPVATPPEAGPTPPAPGGGTPSSSAAAVSLLEDGLDRREWDAPFAPSPRPQDPGMSRGQQGGIDLQEILFRRLAEFGGPSRATSAARTGSITPSEPRVVSQKEVTRRPMELLSEYAPKNTSEKIAAFKGLFEADEALDKASGKLHKEERALAGARRALAQAPDSPALLAELARLERTVATTAVDVDKARGLVASSEGEVRRVLKGQWKGDDSLIDTLDIAARKQTQVTYHVDVDGRSITLTDNNRSYASTGRSGLAVVDPGQPVDPVIDATDFGPSAKTILKATSHHEGKFASVNGYDRAGVSVGIIQFAGGGPGSMLSKLIQHFKEKDPSAFKDTLGKFGIDVTGKPPQLQCRDGSGRVLTGDAAAQFIGRDPGLCAVLAASGSNMSMKAAQVELAGQLMDKQRNQTVGNTGVPAKDLITTEYGNALLYDRSVNLGPGAPNQALDRVVRNYLEAHPGADLRGEPARSEIEGAFIDWAEKSNPERFPPISRSTDHDAGSFRI